MTAAPATEAPAPPATDERLAYRGPIQRLLTRPDIGALVGAVSLWLFFWAVSDVFGVTAGAANYLDVAAGLGIMAVAVSLLMIGGEFDLSAGSMTGATAMLVMLLGKPQSEFGGAGMSLYIAVPLSLIFALAVGYFNATIVERTGLPSFIVTLGSFFVLIGAKLGFAKLFTDKVIVEGLDEAAGYDFWVADFRCGLGPQPSHTREPRLDIRGAADGRRGGNVGGRVRVVISAAGSHEGVGFGNACRGIRTGRVRPLPAGRNRWCQCQLGLGGSSGSRRPHRRRGAGQLAFRTPTQPRRVLV